MDAFEFDDVQATAIVNFQLGQLAGLEILKIEKELGELHAKIEGWREILADEAKVLGIVKTELMVMKKSGRARPPRKQGGIQMVNRQQMILLQLSNAKGPVTSQQLAQALECSSRTIKTEMPAVAKVLAQNGAKLISKRNQGYSLEVQNEEAYRSLYELLNLKAVNLTLANSNEESRLLYLARKLVASARGVKAEELAEELYLSRSALREPLRRACTFCESFHLKTRYAAGQGIRVTGQEHLIRIAMEGKKAAYARHQSFFNTHAVAFNFIAGLSYALEKDAKDGKVPGETIDAIKASLMGPTAGMFDSIFFNCLRVIGAGIAIGLCAQGNILGTLIFILLYGVSQSVLKYILLKLGYTLGTSFIDTVFNSGLMAIATRSAAILGLIMVGAMTQRLYYTPTGFFIKERFVAYTELKRLVHGGGRKADSIELRDGTTYRLPRRQLQALEALKEQKVFRLAGKKKS